MALQHVQERISLACERSGRLADSVRLVAVTKGRTPQEIRHVLVGQGQLALGENRVQEWQDKAPDFAEDGIEWHFIGNLQRNKVRFCHGIHLIHSLNSERLANELQRIGERDDVVFRVLLEANLGSEDTKQGASSGQLEQLSEYTQSLSHVSLEGLMTMAPYDSTETELHSLFSSARQWRDKLGLKELSMGMSGDFEIAIEEGATIVRIGSLLFEADAR